MDLLNLLFQSLSAQGNQTDNEEELTPEQEAEIAQDGITVTGVKRQADPRPVSQNPSYTDPAERPEITPRYVLNDDRMPPTKEEMKELIPRNSGYFGTKGSLRDILGTLSDAFLVQGGGEAEYRNLRDRERMSDAMYGFTNNPQQAMERLAAQGFTKEASDLQQNFATQEQQRATLQSQDEGRKALARDKDFDNKDKGYNRIARWTAAGVPYGQLVTAAKNYGISEEELNALGISANMTDAQRQQIAGMDMSVNQQMQIPFTERKVKAQEINANRPRPAPQPRQPRAQTDEERLERAYNTPPAQRTEYQKSLITRKERVGKSSGRNSERRAVTPPVPRAGWGVKPL